MNRQSDVVTYFMLIDGELVESESGAWLDCIDPSTEAVIGRVPAASKADVDRAVQAANRAFPAWAGIAPKKRAQLVRQVAAKLRERADEILRIEVMDTGNTIAKMRHDVASAGDTLDYYAGLASELKGESIPASAEHIHFTLREPYGVVGRIIPFNHPIKFAANALAAPLVAGNTVVLKTPDTSPLSAGILAEICQEVLPAGVVNIISGAGVPAGDAIVRHPLVKRIAFTGSVPTGMAIQRAAAESGVKAVTLELGGKNPMIVFPDSDPEKIAKAAVRGMNFAWQGQSCGSMSRLLLHESLYEAVVPRVVEIVKGLKLGPPLEDESQMGPINSAAHYKRVLAMIEKGKEDGAELLTGGNRPQGKAFEKGFWVEPTVFGRVTQDMRIANEEIFGPVMSILSWKTEEEAITIANATDYGLTASVWTRDYGVAMRMLRQVRSGYVWINGASGHFYGTPFGGYRNSGIGREEGLDELLSYTEVKTAHLMGIDE